MKAIDIKAPGGPEQLVLGEQADPVPKAHEVRIRVGAAGVNRPDVLQRLGKYAPPPGESLVPGLEVAGTVDAVGPEVTDWSVGQPVMALVGGGGYAELCVAPAVQCLPVPDGVSPQVAAAVPETWFTVWANVFEHASLQVGERLLVHGGSSGIGHTAIQLAKARGALVAVTCGSAAKVAFCQKLGADLAINYREEDFVSQCQTWTEGQGVDVILDMVAGDYFPRNLDALAFRGRHVNIAALRGAKVELPIWKLMAKQAVLTGSFLRSRPPHEKARLTKAVTTELLPLLARGEARPHVDRTFPLAEAADAHRLMEAGDFLGKLVLVP